MLASLKKMLALEWSFFKISAIADLQVSINLAIQFFNDILWYLLQIILFETLYLNVSQLGGWGIIEMRVFLGILFLVDALQMIFFAQNFDAFSEKIAQRDLDLLLMRPVSSQQLMTCQKLQCGYILNAIFALCWLVWSLSMLPSGFTWIHFLLTLVVIPAGLAMFYTTRLVLCTLTLIFTRVENFHELYYTFFKIGQRPDRLYGPGLRYFILMVFPVGMIASMPSRVLVDPTDVVALLSLICVTAIFLFISNRFWHWSVKRYMRVG